MTIRYYIANPGKTTARAVRLLDDEQAPEGMEVRETEDYFEPEHVANNHVLSAYHNPGRCGFCGGPTPCLRDD